ncbi:MULTISPECIES: amylo-alpha-1,6-glucosidase [unclassified Beijerinckia]|uniref:amylo-alpha-1,6-glucosidase n=1 Tax=unclassified Beijerinckia TaxID=2638183 RepID=UPI000894C54A|nr:MULTISPECIES: amylo-alpha-1,6-glucosidase [unclassified Beijerinckia]MDH7797244.1 glycogen debranching enzyme [Beijerinckia sp. GAS462]SEC77806.1 Glycogen debranching enzyme (alpha-1,6-glucosidase) [Beijerinckia sp. 28-YEA-48]
MLMQEVPVTPFYIPGTDLAARPLRTLKYGDSFAVLDSHADIGATAGGPDGVFFFDTRYLSRLEMLLNGQQLLLLSSNVRDDNSMLTVDLTNPDIYVGGKLVLPKNMLHFVRTLFLWRGSVYQRVRVQSHDDRSLQIQLTFNFSSDFADLFEVRGARRMRRGGTTSEVCGNAEVTLKYRGLDDGCRATTLLFEPVPRQLSSSLATYNFELQPYESRSIYVMVTCDGGGERQAPLPFRKGLRAAFQEHKVASRGMATVTSSNPIFNEVLCRSMADLAMLTTQTPQGPYPYAGIPWYSTTFGRDGIITALQMLWCDSRVAKGVLRRLAVHQAKDFDPLADAEPGKILHEMRGGEMAALREVPFGLYYGSVDATPLFVMLAGLYTEHTGDLETLRELWPHIEAALGWIDGLGDPDRDGFVEYQRADETGLANQGWKDSQDAIFHADGALAHGPIALCEVQGYVYAAKRLTARGARRLGKYALGEALDAQASKLAQQFEAAFWCEDIGTYAIALDGHKRPCRVRSSNAGHLLFSGIVSPERAEAVMRDLMRPSFFSGWGIRTLAREERRYNPMSYHNGSVWPHDNSLIAAGFARYGYKDAVDRVFKGLFDAASYTDLRRLPELYCGFQRGRERGPTLYPVACSPQAWAAGTPLLLLQSSCGLEFDPDRHEILLRNPRLPSFLGEVTLRNLRLGHSTVDLMLRRHNDDVSLQVLRNEGQIRVAAVYS